ncbi:hypothetical protein [Chryseobacterium shigense]|uniref:Contractile injection system tube protein N-terminal domain-containing protein n=1 Tax=Chryseobacterium shigense TaxID=297244 RepID=A0A841N352_9FLAO|nr:hypothetical protein [Chryseobacterium shigense]MBB6369151.1 hypothetical protein [Chryseobacterium shigense]
MIQAALGIIDKMRIEVFPTKDYAEPPNETIFVQLNPEKYTMKNNVVFCEGQAMGTTGSDLKFNKIEGEEVTFDFLFDSSGIVPQGKTVKGKGTDSLTGTLSAIGESLKPAYVDPFGEVESVEKQVEGFKDSLMKYDGKSHQTPYLKLLWGGYSLSCRLKSMDIEYYLFRKDGRPVRAKVKCLFKGTVKYELMVAEQKKSSPDLTHERTIQMNDKLPLLAESIYESDDFYIDVAKSNKLLSFRNINTGQKLKFPPVK